MIQIVTDTMVATAQGDWCQTLRASSRDQWQAMSGMASFAAVWADVEGTGVSDSGAQFRVSRARAAKRSGCCCPHQRHGHSATQVINLTDPGAWIWVSRLCTLRQQL